MSRAFMRSEGRGIFIMGALALWFGVLGLIGRSLPAGAALPQAAAAKGQSVAAVRPWTTSRMLALRTRPGHGKIISSQRLRTARMNEDNIAVTRSIGTALEARRARRPLTALRRSAISRSIALRGDTAQNGRRLGRAGVSRPAQPIISGRWQQVDGSFVWQQVTAADVTVSSAQAKRAQPKWVRRDGMWVFDTYL